MPTYDYQCDACDHTWELFQNITEDPISKCPACGKKKARRLFGTGAALMFKGSGFYETDYRSESYKKSAQTEAKSSESSTGSDASGSENAKTKPESKLESKPSATKTGEAASKPATDKPQQKKSKD